MELNRRTPGRGQLAAKELATFAVEMLAHRPEKKRQRGSSVDLQAGRTRISNPTRLTLDDGWNNPSVWSAEALFAVNLRARIFRRRCLPEPGWRLDLLRSGHGKSPGAKKTMRVSVTGGTPQVIYTGGLYDGTSCSKFPATLCVIGERSADRKQLALTPLIPCNAADLSSRNLPRSRRLITNGGSLRTELAFSTFGAAAKRFTFIG
jgi:hypothetical protein